MRLSRRRSDNHLTSMTIVNTSAWSKPRPKETGGGNRHTPPHTLLDVDRKAAVS